MHFLFLEFYYFQKDLAANISPLSLRPASQKSKLFTKEKVLKSCRNIWKEISPIYLCSPLKKAFSSLNKK
jgi:hypothetical protein